MTLSSSPSIRVSDLNFTYPGGQAPVLKGICFTVEKGGVLGLLGPSGAGKSTTQKILIGLLSGHQGQAEILGKPIEQWDKDLYQHIGVSFELPNHFTKLTARENLTYFASLYRNTSLGVAEVLSWLGLEDAIDQRVANFSKGMKNRLSVARALIHNPDIIFLDEPTAGLDPVSTLKVQKLIAQLKDQGKTILINTHNMVIAEQSCDQVAFIHQGKIAEINHPDALRLKFGDALVTVEVLQQGQPVKHQFPLHQLGRNAEFLSLIAKQPVQRIHSNEATLDDVFRRITGAELTQVSEAV